MSKIESALAKARALGQLPHGTRGSGRGLVVVPAIDKRNEGNAGAEKEIARMSEGRVLTREELARHRIIHHEMHDVQDMQVVQAFREVRTKIVQKAAGKNCSILVTGFGKDAGTSFVSLNLAVAFALDDTKTCLLVDCNLGDSALNSLVEGRGEYGLTDYLQSDKISIEQIIQSVGIPRLRIISAGHGHKPVAEYFTSSKLKHLIHSVRSRYPDRYVLFDTPPVMESADTRILMESADYVLLVIPYGRATERDIVAVTRTIGEKKLLGVVFNNEPRLPQLNWRKAAGGSASNTTTAR